MAVPEFYYFLRPTLVSLSKGGNHDLMSIRSNVFDQMRLSSDDLAELTASQSTTRAVDRVNWALAYLKAAKLVDQPKRAHYFITARGSEYLLKAPEVITPKDLRVFSEFVAFESKKPPGAKANGAGTEAPSTSTPEDTIEGASSLIRQKLAEEVLEQVKGMSPAFFERLIVQLMLRLGYGGPSNEWGRVLGKTGDGGVDGVINQDRLGLDKIYLQAKRYSSGSVGSPEVQGFAGALIGQGARKGVFITTSTFSSAAEGYVASLKDYKISLISGIELAELMIDHDLGVALAKRYDIKRLDSDFFTEQ